MEYANLVWHNCTQVQSERLERIQLECARIVTGSVKGTKHKQLYSETGWLTLAERRTYSQITKMYELVNHLTLSMDKFKTMVTQLWVTRIFVKVAH